MSPLDGVNKISPNTSGSLPGTVGLNTRINVVYLELCLVAVILPLLYLAKHIRLTVSRAF